MPRPLPDTDPETEQNRRGRLFLEDRRLDVGLQWSEVARDMLKLYGVKISADYLYKIKRGASPLAKMSVDAREAMRKVLRIGAEDWTAETGLYSPDAMPPEDAPQPVTPEPRPLPDGLQSAITLYGKRFSDLLDPAWQQYMAKFRWREGQPEDAESWLDLYRDLSRAGIVPGEG